MNKGNIMDINIPSKGFDLPEGSLRQKIELEVPKILSLVVVPEKPGVSIGIEETKDVVLFATLFADSIIKSLADGKITITDAPYFFNAMIKLPKAISGIEKVPAEISDLDENEMKELIQIVKDNLGVPTDQCKTIVEKSLTLVYAAFDLIKAATAK